MTNFKVTIRGVEEECWNEVRAIHQYTGVPYGRLVTQALWDWIAQLPEGEELQVSRPALEEE
jgi:hypothetical protein